MSSGAGAMASATGNSTSALAPGLARKVKKILEIKAESPDLILALSTLSSFYKENTPPARRQLRSTVEKRSLTISNQFLSSAESVIQALDAVQVSLNQLTSNCGAMSSVLSTTKTTSASLLSETERLQAELEGVERKQDLVARFLDQYQLAPKEEAALQGEEVNAAFFLALARVRTIHDHCRSLLRTHHQRAGLELMDAMAQHQETAYERLCRWVQAQCRSIGEYDAPEVDPLLHTAVAALRERPVLFKYCAEEVATARHTALFQRFITALTRGGPGGVPRPIEMHAHDPQRYINDMLAWVHQALASEREFVVALFGDEQRSADSQGFGEPAAESTHTAALLERIFESICRPLRVRVEQVLMTGPPLLLCFQLTQLLGFYHGLATRILGGGGPLTQTLASGRDMAHRVFLEQLKARGDKLRRHPPAPPKDLSPPPQVSETVHQMLEIISAWESALAAGNNQLAKDSDASDALSPVLSAVLEPLLEVCERSAEALTPDAPSRVDEVANIDPTARPIYLLNCTASLLTVLQHRPPAQAQVKQLSERVEQYAAELVGGAVSRLLARCGVAEVAERLRLYTQQQQHTSNGQSEQVYSSPASDPALPLAAIAEALRSFFVLASSPDALPEFMQLQVPRLRVECVSRLTRALSDTYEAIVAAVEDPANGYQEQGGAAAIKHSPAQVRTILGVL